MKAPSSSGQGWALDLGTTNSVLARWDRAADRPRICELPSICRDVDEADPLQAPRMVPSALEILGKPSLLSRLGAHDFIARRWLLGRLATIGRPAVTANLTRMRPAFVSSFKRELCLSPLTTVARVAERPISAREATRLFLRELLAEVRRTHGERIRDLVVTTPVEAYESYRAEVAAACRSLGVRRVRFLDEPVAAALGYGIGLDRSRLVLILDIGGGTTHLALVRIDGSRPDQPQAEIVAKAGLPVGGNLVDRWILEDLCAQRSYTFLDHDSPDDRLWRRLMLSECCRVKETLLLKERAVFELEPFEDFRRFEARVATGTLPPPELSRDGLVRILEQRGFYSSLDGCLEGVLERARRLGIAPSSIDDVLMVGGSTLLPDVYSRFGDRFGRERVRAWQPFEAVAYGACSYAADRVVPADFIVHDYALLTHDLKTQQPSYTTIIPRGTRFPTAMDFWKKALVPTCALGEPETLFKLVICEVGDPGDGDERRFGWDAAGRLHSLGHPASDGEPYVVRLNDSNPVLGRLRPPHRPGDRHPRLQVGFGVNADRWLCATVTDLATRARLMHEEPVVRLM